MIMTRDEIAQMVSDYKAALECKVTSEFRVQDLTIRAETLQYYVDLSLVTWMCMIEKSEPEPTKVS